MTDFVILGFAGLGVGKPFMEQGTGGIACQCDVDCIAVFLQLNLGILAAFKMASITWVVLTRRAVCKTETMERRRLRTQPPNYAPSYGPGRAQNHFCNGLLAFDCG